VLASISTHRSRLASMVASTTTDHSGFDGAATNSIRRSRLAFDGCVIRIWGLMGVGPPLPLVRVSRSLRLCHIRQHHPSFAFRVRLGGQPISSRSRLAVGEVVLWRPSPRLLFDE